MPRPLFFLLAELALGVGALPTAEKVRRELSIEVAYRSNGVALAYSTDLVLEEPVLCEYYSATDP